MRLYILIITFLLSPLGVLSAQNPCSSDTIIKKIPKRKFRFIGKFSDSSKPYYSPERNILHPKQITRLLNNNDSINFKKDSIESIDKIRLKLKKVGERKMDEPLYQNMYKEKIDSFKDKSPNQL